MRSGATAFVRLVTILVMALGLGAMTSFSAAAQSSGELTCQITDPTTGDIDQSGTCTVTVDDDGVCTVTVNGVAASPDDATIAQGACEDVLAGDCPVQFILEDGTIVQVTGCDTDETPVAPGETPAATPAETPVETPAETPVETPAETPVETETETETETPVETETETETDVATDDGGEAEEEEDVEGLPDTGQGQAGEQGSSSSIVVLLGAMSVLMLGAAAALRQRRQA